MQKIRKIFSIFFAQDILVAPEGLDIIVNIRLCAWGQEMTKMNYFCFFLVKKLVMSKKLCNFVPKRQVHVFIAKKRI